MESRQDPLTRKICTSKSDLVDTHANLAIRLTMKRINLPPSATDFFHHGADDCINKLNSYFDQMKGGARVQLDKNKGEKQLPIREIVPDLAQFYQDVLARSGTISLIGNCFSPLFLSS